MLYISYKNFVLLLFKTFNKIFPKFKKVLIKIEQIKYWLHDKKPSQHPEFTLLLFIFLCPALKIVEKPIFV